MSRQYIDPWVGYSEAMQGLGKVFSEVGADEVKRKERLRQEETRKGIEDIMAKGKETETYTKYEENPEYASTLRDAEMANMPPEPVRQTPVPYGGKEGESLWSATPAPAVSAELSPADQLAAMTSRTEGLRAALPEYAKEQGVTPLRGVEATRPKYSRDDLLQQAADYATARSDFTALKGIENAIDVTSKVDERSQKMIANLMATAKAGRQAGVDPAGLKKMLMDQIIHINRLAGKQVIDPASVDKWTFNDSGNVAIQNLDNGGKLFTVLQPDGTTTMQYAAPTKPTDQHFAGPVHRVKLGTETVEYVPSFASREDLQRYVNAGAPFDRAYEFGATKLSKLNENTPPIQVLMPDSQARITAQGVMMQGPYAGLMVYKDSKRRDDPPFVYVPDGKGGSVTVPVAGGAIDQKGAAAAYAPEPGAPLPAPPAKGAAANVTGQAGDLSASEKKANLKGKTDPVGMRVVRRINGVQPAITEVIKHFDKLPGETGIQPVNEFFRKGLVKIGNKKISDYDTYVKEITREVQTALSGSQSSQKLVLQQLELLSTAKTNAQRASALRIINDLLEKRKQGELAPVYDAQQKARNAAPSGSLRGTEREGYVYTGDTADTWRDKSKWVTKAEWQKMQGR